MMLSEITTTVLCVLFAVAAAAQQSPAVPPAEPNMPAPQEPASAALAKPAEPPANLSTEGATLGSGDLLEISVFGVQELSQSARVSSTGDISLPLIGRVPVAGLTTAAAERLLESKFRDGGFVRDPQVTIMIKEFVSQNVSVLGEVSRPGNYPVYGNRRLLDVLSAAGGTTQRAGRLVYITHRDQPDHPVSVKLDPNLGGDAGGNVEVRSGDTIVVTKAGIVYVIGDVQLPGGFLMDNNENISVLQAVALAHGPKGTAKLHDAKIIRRSPGGVEQMPIDLSKILTGKATDVALRDNDIVFVPNSTAKSAGRRGLESIIQVATGIAIYHPL